LVPSVFATGLNNAQSYARQQWTPMIFFSSHDDEPEG
jgi:hypothetical protein